MEFNSGIARIDNKIYTSQIFREDVFEILCNNSMKYAYNATQNKIYKSSKEVENDFRTLDSLEISKHRKAFLLLMTATSPAIKTQLYSCESITAKGINDLVFFSGSNRYNIEYFNKPDYKHLILKPLLKNTEFVEGKIIWSDSDIVLIQHFNSTFINDLMRITAFDASGKQLFTISQNDFPNIDKMLEVYETSFRILLFDDVTREKDRIYIIFDEYGAVCMNLFNGKMVWKYEQAF